MASLRWRGVTFAFGQATVMPRPIAAGVLGIARTMAVPCGSACSRKPSGRPAMIDTATSLCRQRARARATASAALCGLTAMTTALAGADLPRFGLSATPRRASALRLLAGCGSITVSLRGSSPRVSQPSSMAEPILPAPSRTSAPENFRSGLSAGLVVFLARVLVGLFTRFMARSYRDFRRYASPEVSNMAESIASRADLPAQITN